MFDPDSSIKRKREKEKRKKKERKREKEEKRKETVLTQEVPLTKLQLRNERIEWWGVK